MSARSRAREYIFMHQSCLSFNLPYISPGFMSLASFRKGLLRDWGSGGTSRRSYSKLPIIRRVGTAGDISTKGPCFLNCSAPHHACACIKVWSLESPESGIIHYPLSDERAKEQGSARRSIRGRRAVGRREAKGQGREGKGGGYGNTNHSWTMIRLGP